jgi:hypothetical protein
LREALCPSNQPSFKRPNGAADKPLPSLLGSATASRSTWSGARSAAGSYAKNGCGHPRSCDRRACLEHPPAKWIPVGEKKRMRQQEDSASDLIQSDRQPLEEAGDFALGRPPPEARKP